MPSQCHNRHHTTRLLPSSQTYRGRPTSLAGTLCCLALFVLAGPGLGAHSPRMRVDTSQDRQAISPLIYGTNSELRADDGYTARRLGGNRTTAWNWENGASNAGADWHHSSDDHLPSSLKIPSDLAQNPGQVAISFHEQSLKLKVPCTLITLPMAGYVAADRNGTVNETAPSPRWRAVFPAPDSPLALEATPANRQNALYNDGLVRLLTSRFGSAASPGGIWGYLLDNEPALWLSTHPRVHPLQATCDEVVRKGLETARMVKDLDPAARVLGPEAYGFMEYLSNQQAPDWSQIQYQAQEEGKTYKLYLEYYLDRFRAASDAAGVRLLDALSIHWYPEARGGGQRITTKDHANPFTNQARIQAPRSLWDPGYREDSWISKSASWALPLLPLLNQAIDTWYPGTQLAITEYQFGGDMHISGGLAQADALGIFGRHGVYLATLWPGAGRGNYVSAAFKLFRNADGHGLAFGDTAVQASTSDPARSSLYAATDGPGGQVLHLVIINKSADEALVPDLELAGSTGWQLDSAWGFDAASSRLRSMAQGMVLEGMRLKLELPPLSACHVVLTGRQRP